MSAIPERPTAEATPAPRKVRLPRLAGDGPHTVSADGVDLVVVRAGGRFRAFQGLCPHRGALLGEGELAGGTLVCRNHRWRFDAATGARLDGPECLASFPLSESDGELWVELPGRGAEAVADRAARQLRTLDDLPGPKGLPLVGNLFDLELTRLHEILERWAGEYGSLYVYRIGGRSFLTISDPDVAEEALRRRPDEFRRMSAVEPVFREMGAAGVFSAEGPAWRRERRLSMEALSFRHLRDFYPTLSRLAGKLCDRWRRLAAAATPIDVVEDLKRFTVDVTTMLTLGHDVDTLGRGEDVIQRQLELVFPAFNRRIFAVLPTWRLLRMPADRRLDRALSELRDWMLGLVAAARTRLAAAPASPPSNFLEAMVQARDEAGEPFPEEAILGNLLTMLLAGEDTTAYTLAWAVHELCDRPEAVAALRRELDEHSGGAAVPATFEVANRLAVAGAIANETMRLRPVAPILGLAAISDTTLGDVLVPRGTQLSILVRPPVVDESHFEAPREFRPERWLPGFAGAHEPSVHMPFGSGPRLCPGRTLALLEMKVVLAALYGSFDVVRRGARGEVGENFAFTMTPTDLRVELRPR